MPPLRPLHPICPMLGKGGEEAARKAYRVFCLACQSHSPIQKLLLGPGDLLCHLLPLVQVCVF